MKQYIINTTKKLNLKAKKNDAQTAIASDDSSRILMRHPNLFKVNSVPKFPAPAKLGV